MSNYTPVQPKSHIVRDNNVPPAVGRMVDYVLSESDSHVAAGQVRPAVIVYVDGTDKSFLAVFTRGGADQLQPIHHVQALHSEGAEVPGTWHWPPPRELVFKNVPVQAIPPPSEEIPVETAPPDSQPAGLEAHIAEKGYPVGEDPFTIKRPKP